MALTFGVSVWVCYVRGSCWPFPSCFPPPAWPCLSWLLLSCSCLLLRQESPGAGGWGGWPPCRAPGQPSHGALVSVTRPPSHANTPVLPPAAQKWILVEIGSLWFTPGWNRDPSQLLVLIKKIFSSSPLEISCTLPYDQGSGHTCLHLLKVSNE